MTEAEQTAVYKAAIEMLAAALKVAIQTRDNEAFNAAVAELDTLSTEFAVPPLLKGMASTLHDEAAFGMLDAALTSMTQKVASLSGAAAQLRAAAAQAKKDQDALSIPALAKAASDALSAFEKLKSAVDAVHKDLRSATTGELGDLPQKLKKLIADVKSLRQTASSLG